MSADLLCTERVTDCRALHDPSQLSDRVLENLLKTEESYLSSSSYLQCANSEITPAMRRTLASWMLDVVIWEECHETVFSLAMNYVDRFLSTTRLSADKLQALGATCLLISSKMVQSTPIQPELLSYFTKETTSAADIRPTLIVQLLKHNDRMMRTVSTVFIKTFASLDLGGTLLYLDSGQTSRSRQAGAWNFEFLVSTKLKWDLQAVTANDFVPHLIHRVPIDPSLVEMVERHATTLISLATREYKFCPYPGSIIAGASFAAALVGINWSSQGGWPLSRLMEFVGKLLHVEVDYLSNCFQSLEDTLSQALDEEANPEDRGSNTPTDVNRIDF